MESDRNSDDSRKTANNMSMESKESEKSPCLYVSLKTGENSSVWKKLESLGFKVNNESRIATAAKLCSTTRMALIVLEDCEEKAFIEAIKMPNACNEHTPIVFISSGPLSDIVRHMMQEQFIDELVFKCLTLECDLGSAVARLKTQPGRFAVTPKVKRPVSVRKRKLEAASPSSKNTCPGAVPVQHSTYQMNSFMMPMPPKQQQHFYHGLPVERMPCYNALPPCPELNFHTREESNEQAKKDDSAAKNMHSFTYMLGNPQPHSAYQWRTSVIVKAENTEQSLNMKENILGVVNKISGEITADSGEEKGNSAESKKTKADKIPLKDSDVGVSSPSVARKKQTSGQMKTKQRSSLPSGQTSLERKEQHLDKEKKRREQITKSWHWLRQLVPNCETYADKATVFEMSVAYLHHCWKYHGPILQQINKEFVFLHINNISPEDMERNVTEVLEKERKAFGNIVESRSSTE